jgi:[acyl-carrier-protein] S-malonyltransferase
VDKVSIINQNSEFSFILSGHYNALLRVLDNAKIDGAMQTRMLPVTHPYHSHLLQKASEDFALQIKEMSISDSIFPIVSAMNHKIITSKEEIFSELVKNLYQPFQWWKTFDFMLSAGVGLFIECGAGESLYKVGKFIPGEFTIVNLKKMGKYINE